MAPVPSPAHQAGRAAYLSGQPYAANPYVNDDAAFVEFADGYDAADDAAQPEMVRIPALADYRYWAPPETDAGAQYASVHFLHINGFPTGCDVPKAAFDLMEEARVVAPDTDATGMLLPGAEQRHRERVRGMIAAALAMLRPDATMARGIAA